MKNKKPINVYWSPDTFKEDSEDWSLMYEKPKTLYLDLLENKINTSVKDTFFSCPAFSSKAKKMLVFKNLVKSEYHYSTENNQQIINPVSDRYIHAEYMRPATVTFGPTIGFSYTNLLFADESLEVSIIPPMFHKPKYMKYGSVVFGEFDIGKWFRQINFEVLMWENSGDFILEEEPLYYLEFKTKRPIVFHKFILTQNLRKYSLTNQKSSKLFGENLTLLDRYHHFKRSGMREIILTEIKKNLIDESSFKF